MDIDTLTPIVNGQPFTGGDTLSIVEPATGETIGTLRDTGTAGVDAAVSSARAALPGWAGSTPKERATALLAIADAMDARVEEFAELESRDVGKPLADARGEIASAADKYRFFAGASRSLTAALSNEYKPGITSFVRREPIGVVAAIAPWNYPMGLTSWKIGPALAAGNTVVLKPPTEASMTSMLLADVARDILPPGVLNVITGGGRSTGAALAAHPGVDMISLTGGTDTGKAMMHAAADGVKKLHLELGGKAPVILFDDADLDKFARVIKGAMFRNSGQDCTAATRIYVSKNRRNDVLDLLAEIANGVRVGNGFLEDNIEMGPVVSEKQRRTVSGFVDRSLATGHTTVVAGGKAPDRPGSYYLPTIISGVQQHDEILQQEIFGPVVVVSNFTDVADAVAKANDIAYGLAASVWTKDIDRAIVTAARIQAGTVWINEHGPTAAEMPFGGYKQSGFGRDLSVHAIEDHTNLKHIAIGHGQTL